MECKYCGAEIEESLHACPCCGNNLEEDLVIADEVEVITDDLTDFCNDQAEEELIPEQSEPTGQEKPRKKIWQIAIAVGCCIALLYS